MFLAYEEALRQHLTGILPGKVLGTFDQPNLEEQAIYLQVEWQRYGLAGQQPGQAVALEQLFAVRIGCGAARISPAEVAAAVQALGDAYLRLIAFRYGERPGQRKVTFINPPPPVWQGAAAELAIYFTLPGVVAGTQ